MPGDLARRPLLHDLAAFDHDEPVSKHGGIDRVMRHHQGGAAEVGEVPAEFAADKQPGTRVEGGQGLVQQQQLRIHRQRAG